MTKDTFHQILKHTLMKLTTSHWKDLNEKRYNFFIYVYMHPEMVMHTILPYDSSTQFQ